MITQAIKIWFRKLFAWWPWKQTAPVEYPQITSVVTRGPASETGPRSTWEGTAPQPGVNPRLSTLEDQSERLIQQHFEVSDTSISLPSPSLSHEERGAVGDAENIPLNVPTTQQRLEFLRYLVQRGIVNEGFDKNKAER